jgi:GNAT superfamily N-acetyltransferase
MSRPLATGYTIRSGTRAHLPALPEIERIAAERFRGLGLPDSVLTDTTPLDEFEEACDEGRLFVAIAPDGAIAGFALGEALTDRAHLEEVDVLPAHGRRGVGAALVARVERWARARGVAELTLTTFRDVPWNAPFYRGLGFEVLPAAAWDATLRGRVQEEAAQGLDPDIRVVMRLRLLAEGGPASDDSPPAAW